MIGLCQSEKPVEVPRNATAAALAAVTKEGARAPVAPYALTPAGTKKVLAIGLCPSTTPAAFQLIENPDAGE